MIARYELLAGTDRKWADSVLVDRRRPRDARSVQRWQRQLFQLGLSLNAALTRSRRWSWLEQRLFTPMSIRLVKLVRGSSPSSLPATPANGDVAVEALAREWERLIGNRRYARVVHVDMSTQTAYGEIVGRCPLRGTGDVEACHRLMAFDRGLLSAYDARFVVLESQAEPGKVRCKIAIRPQLLDASDLIPAHERL